MKGKTKEKELRGKAKAITIPKMEAAMAREARQDAKAWPDSIPKEKRLEMVDRLIRVTDGEVQKDNKRLRRLGAPEKAVSFGRGVHSGLSYAEKVASSAKRGGRIMDRKGRVRKQKKGSII